MLHLCNFSTVQQDLDNQLVEDFLKESMIMKQLNHKNVLTMFGVSVHEDKPCVLLPLMNNGDLHNYVRKHNKVNKLPVIIHVFHKVKSLASMLQNM